MRTIPVLTPAGMRAWEGATWKAGVREAEVIARVGRRVAMEALRMARRGRVLLLAGKGHNGDDVRAAMPHLAGCTPVLLDVLDPRESLPVLERELGLRPSCVVDGVFGIGLNRPLSAEWVRCIEALNRSGAPVLAVDVPSGLNAGDGSDWGAVVVAEETLAVGAPKTGLLAGPAAPRVGRVRVASDVGLVPWDQAGIPPLEVAGSWGGAGDLEDWPPRRGVDMHKGSLGHVLVMGGSTGYHGAAVLAVRGALRANPGLVTAWTHPGTYLPVASQLASAMVHPWEPCRVLPRGVSCIVAGPGLTGDGVEPWLGTLVREWWRSAPAAMLVDASALDFLEPDPVEAQAPRVITPHPGEAGRLLGTSAAAVQLDRQGALRGLMQRFEGAWVVLKGHATLVGRAGEKPWWNPTGNPWLAQGGSGDVLAGFLGGLLAQPGLALDPGRTLRFGVMEHGAAADRLLARGVGWTTEDLAGEVGRRSAPPGWGAA